MPVEEEGSLGIECIGDGELGINIVHRFTLATFYAHALSISTEINTQLEFSPFNLTH